MLNSSGNIRIGERYLVSDRSLYSIASLHALHTLEIDRWRGLTDRGLKLLAHGSCAGVLTRLSLMECPNISDTGLSKVAKACVNLEFVNVGNCKALTDRSLVLLSKYCSYLHTLDVFGLPGYVCLYVCLFACLFVCFFHMLLGV
jgi:Leucine Rich repeat